MKTDNDADVIEIERFQCEILRRVKEGTLPLEHVLRTMRKLACTEGTLYALMKLSGVAAWHERIRAGYITAQPSRYISRGHELINFNLSPDSKMSEDALRAIIKEKGYEPAGIEALLAYVASHYVENGANNGIVALGTTMPGTRTDHSFPYIYRAWWGGLNGALYMAVCEERNWRDWQGFSPFFLVRKRST